MLSISSAKTSSDIVAGVQVPAIVAAVQVPARSSNSELASAITGSSGPSVS